MTAHPRLRVYRGEAESQLFLSSPSQGAPHPPRSQISRGKCNQGLLSNLLNLLPSLSPPGSGQSVMGVARPYPWLQHCVRKFGAGHTPGLPPNTCERSSPPALSVHWEYGVQDRCPGFLGSPSATIGTKQKNGKGSFLCRKCWCTFTECSSWGTRRAAEWWRLWTTALPFQSFPSCDR